MALVVVRHPLHSTLAELTRELAGHSHSAVVPDDKLRTALAEKLREMLLKWRNHTTYWLKQHPASLRQIIKYEDLQASTYEVMAYDVLPFLGMDTSRPPVQQWLSCALSAPDRNSTHRIRGQPFPFVQEDFDLVREAL